MIRLIVFIGACAAVIATGMVIALCYAAGGAGGLWWLALIAVAVLAAVLRYRWARPRTFVRPEPGDAIAGSGRFPDYARSISRLATGTRELRYFDRAVRPELLAIATAIYEHRHGLEDRANPLAAELGAEAWHLLDPDRPQWEDRAGDRRRRGPTVDVFDNLIRRIEAL